MPDRESLIEAAAALASVFFMLAAMFYVGQTYGNGSSLGEEGATVMIVAIVVFIVLVTILGAVLAYLTSEPASDGNAEVPS